MILLPQGALFTCLRTISICHGPHGILGAVKSFNTIFRLKQSTGSLLSQPTRQGHWRGHQTRSAAFSSDSIPREDAFNHSTYQQRSREVVSLVNQLREVGANTLLKVPTIVVCGNQSAGKSSLIEAICGVPLPRNAGTCTRCPTEIRLTEGDPKAWRCTVKVHHEQSNDTKGQTPNKDQEEVAFMSDIRNQEDVWRYVAAAQEALLNPNQHANSFLPNNLEATSGLNWWRSKQSQDSDRAEFTRDSVVVEISGAPVNLTLVDLPGIFHSTVSKDTKKYKDLIHYLVREKISDSQTIIVATVSCKDDIANQAIMDLAREADPSGERTLGVLTKPDTIEENCHTQWVRVMRNEDYPLKLGFFAVRNPSQTEMEKGTSDQMARKAEEEFFRSTPPWSTELREYQHRFGVTNLRQELSRLLVQHISRSLPGMRDEVKTKLAENTAALKCLPTPPSGDAQREMTMLITTLVNNLRDIINGKKEANKVFNAKVEKSFQALQKGIAASRPRFVNGSSQSSGSHLVFKKQLTVTGPVMTDQEVLEVVAFHRTMMLPGFSPYEVVDAVVRRFQGDWQTHSIQCLDTVHNDLQAVILEEVDKVFGTYPRAKTLIGNIIRATANSSHETTQKLLEEVVKMEVSNPPFTMNADYYMQQKEEYKSYGESIPKASQDAPEYMLAAIAYYQVASQRLVDVVSMNVRHYLLEAFANNVQGALPTEISNACGANGDTSCYEELMSEESSLRDRRAVLMKQRGILENAWKMMSSYHLSG